MDKRYNVKLTYDELLHLDGICSTETQKFVDIAKQEASFGLDPICNEILRKSLELGTLKWTHTTITKCTCCSSKPYDYHRYSRSSRYHRKGDLNYAAPVIYSGVSVNSGGIVFHNSIGICLDCWKNTCLPKLVKYIVDNDLPIEIQKNDIANTKYKYDAEHICNYCGRTMFESEMGVKRAIMNDSFYPDICPYCKADSGFGIHKLTGRFRLINVEDGSIKK